MTFRDFVTHKCHGWILTAFILVVFGQMSLAHGAESLLVWPLAEVKSRSAANVSLKPYETRQGRIGLATELLPQTSIAANRLRSPASVAENDVFTITFFADTTYQITIDSVTNHPDGTMIINAKIKDHKLRTVVMTIGPEGFLISLQDMNRAFLYLVTGDTRLATGTVTEIDQKKIPPMIR